MNDFKIGFGFEAAHTMGMEWAEELRSIHGHSWKGAAIISAPQSIGENEIRRIVSNVVSRYNLALILNRLSTELINVSKRWGMKYKTVNGDPSSMNISGAIKKELATALPDGVEVRSVDINITCS